MTTLSHQEFLRPSPRISGREKPRVVRINRGRANRTSVRKPGKAARVDRDMVWLVAISFLALTVSFLVSAAFPLLDLGEDADALAATIAETLAVPPLLMPAGTAAQPTFHEQFELHPTQGDVEEQVATF
jgi:hypothetical protein